jgi:hypothetical protein
MFLRGREDEFLLDLGALDLGKAYGVDVGFHDSGKMFQKETSVSHQW